MKMRCDTVRRAFAALLFGGMSAYVMAQAEADTVAASTAVSEVAGVNGERVKPRFGYVSYSTALQAMPEYEAAQKSLASLRGKYAAETKRAEDEFNSQYEEFLDGQGSYPRSILHKRQSELQELLKRNIAFKEESQRLLAAAENDIFAPLHRKLKAAIATVGQQNGLAFIINIDDNACPYIDSALGENVTLMVIDLLR